MADDDQDYTDMELSPEEVQAVFDKLKMAVKGHMVGAIVYATGAMLASVFKEASEKMGGSAVDLDMLIAELRRIIEKTTDEIKSVN